MFHGTTILCVRRDGKVALAGDGQVTLDKTVLDAVNRLDITLPQLCKDPDRAPLAE